jgi:hypothetical protein
MFLSYQGHQQVIDSYNEIVKLCKGFVVLDSYFVFLAVELISLPQIKKTTSKIRESKKSTTARTK